MSPPKNLARLALLALCLGTAAQQGRAAAPGDDADALTTHAERSGFVETGRYPEVEALCGRFARRWPGSARCTTFGTTPEGRPMLALVVSRSGVLEAAAARAQGVPVVLVQGGIHAGEIDGKDAGFLALRQLLEGEVDGDLLAGQVVVFVPVFNVDGHERFGAWNRPNQRGPRETGWRTTAANLNLNRDYTKADAPEMRAMLALIDHWDPLVYVDLHATNGAQFEHDISIQVEPHSDGDPDLQAVGRALRDGTIARLEAQGSLPLPFYPSFVEHDRPDTGFRDAVSPPRFSHAYASLRNRLGMLVETHSWKPYPERVRATRNTVVAVLGQVAADGRAWLSVARAADARATRLGGTEVALAHRASGTCRDIDFRGYAWTRTPSDISGGDMTRYDESRPQTWRVPLCDRSEPTVSVTVPRGGYLVPAAQAEAVGALLALHGIGSRRLEAAADAVPVEVFRATGIAFAATSFEGRQRVDLEGGWADGSRDIAAGSLFVPINQAKARLAIALLEPRAPDSLAAWGWFNNHFERKEYMEAYVAEQVAREMLSAEPSLRDEFQRRLRHDPDFAADPRARLDFFYRRHPSWDEHHGLYPVFRTADAPG